MCGIVGGVAERDVVPILLEGLRRLEYRGYDSAGLALLDATGALQRQRMPGKVAGLAAAVAATAYHGRVGIAHTRWATHGVPSERNAHPHVSGDRVAVVHNGIIENHTALRQQQQQAGYHFSSDTDTETIAHCIDSELQRDGDLLAAVQRSVTQLEGAFALGVIATDDPQRLIAARRGSPLVIGVGIGEHFIASDASALLPVTRRFIYLEEGDIADLRRDRLTIYAASGQPVERPLRDSELSADAVERGEYRHYMLKEIHEQPRAIAETLEGRIGDGKLLEGCFGPTAAALFDRIRRVTIIACGTSYHAGLVASYWFEGIAGLPCRVEVASEWRYRQSVAEPDTLLVVISQSGETADTLAALRQAKRSGYAAATLAICNVPESSLVRESDLALMTHAGPEIGVASTKAFTTQLVALMLLVIAVGRRHRVDSSTELQLIAALEQLPREVESILQHDGAIAQLAEQFVDKQHTLFLGRGPLYPIAQEGALKLKEISYIHAEAYPAGELKHGPLALVDDTMPIVAVAPNDALLEKLKSNLQEVRARGGELFVFAGAGSLREDECTHLLDVAPVHAVTAPIQFVIPLQLLAYHVAVLRGTDVDQPRNLAKSVTVE